MKAVRKSTGNGPNTNGGGRRPNGDDPNGLLHHPQDASRRDPTAGPSSRRVRPPPSPPTTVEIRGVAVHFPFRPYKCQEDYMGVVLDALLRRENALLESPTGTGKTLCLLCAALAWQREEARMVQTQAEFGVPAAAAVAAAPTSGGDRGDAGSVTTGPAAASGPSARQRSRPAVHRVPTIVYASRTHSQLSQVVRELRSTRYRPKHAVLGSREQMCVNPKVKKAAATASTVNHDCSALTKDRRCQFKNRLEGFTAPSNESSSGGWYGTQPVMDMEDLVLMGHTHRVCPFYYTRSLVEDAELVLVPYNYLFDKDSRSSTLSDIPWENAVVIFDEAHNLESFASESASFDLSSRDIAGCMAEVDKAITYLEMDPDRFGHIKRDNLMRLKAVFMNLEEYVLRKLPVQPAAYVGEKMMDIFGRGASITYSNHVLVLAEIKKLSDIFLEMRGGNSNGAPRLEHFVQCIKRVFGEGTEARCLAKAQSYRVYVSPPQAASANQGPSGFGGGGGSSGRTISYWCFAPAEAMRELANLNVRSILVTSGTLSPLDSYALELDLPFPNRLENPHIISSDQIHVRVMGRGVSQKLLTSSYERRQDTEYYTELGNTLASISKVVPGGMLVFFPSYGVMETAIERWGGPAGSRASNNQGTGTANNFFARRQAKVKTGGSGGGGTRYSFPQQQPSFSYAADQTSASTPWKRLLTHKAVVIEPKTSSDLPDAIEEFHKYLNMPKSRGVALFGVCRGKISEGIDFAHDMCRAVIITGLPFAPSFDPKVKMKREFLDQNRAKQHVKASTNGGFGAQEQQQSSCLSGHQWYTQQAHRAVNQAIGRVIRNKRDYGAVLLLDARFELPGNQNGLSKWIRPHILPDEGFGRANQALIRFYANAKQKEEAARHEIVPPVPPDRPTNVSVILSYEDEGKENQLSEPDCGEIYKVAFIGKSPSKTEQRDQIEAEISEHSPNRSYIPPQRIIERVDMTTSEGSRRASEVLRAEAQQEDIPSSLSMSPTPSSFPSQQDIDFKTRSKLQTPGSTTGVQSPKIVCATPPSAAMRFFQQVQSTMSRDEFDTIKKAVVLMKKFTQKKHRQEFLAAARGILQIILKHSTFENQSRDQKPELIVLLLQLLPRHFTKDGQHCTVDLLFRMSPIRDELKSSLTGDAYVKIHEGFVSLLWDFWFCEEGGQLQDLVKQLGMFLTPLVEKGSMSISSLSQVSKMVPSEVRQVVFALVDQLRAAVNVSKIKEEEKVGTGENAVRVERFRKANAVNQRVAEGDDDTIRAGEVERIDSTFTMEPSKPFKKSKVEDIKNTAIAKATQSQNDKRETHNSISNPYAQKKYPFTKASPETGTEQSTLPEVTKMNVSMLLERRKRGLAHSNVDDGSRIGSISGPSLSKILRQSEEEMFTGITRSKTLRLSSNAPLNLSCTICEQPLEKPYISECGHMACLNCWQQWFGKSHTCPVCRKAASPESIALAIFQGTKR